MTVKVRIKLNRRGIHQVLTSSGVQAVLRRKAEAVAAAVRARGIRVDGEPGEIDLPVTVNVTKRGNRARGYVNLDHPSGAAVEAKDHVLAGAIHAARTA